ncbi:MAG: copper amine oxidase N-terminal domain-containing protein, partial [Caldiserica bacterium]|nr:copper amine oxidase N-terminal domain-containing protein [Caldisericota bacterium]
MRKFISLFLIILVLFGSLPVLADSGAREITVFFRNPEPQEKEIQVFFRDIQIWVDGEMVLPDTEPFIYQDRVFVPIRFIAEALGKEVTWDDSGNRVIIGSPPLDQSGDLSQPEATQITIWVDGCLIPADTEPFIYQDRVFVPIRFI